MPCFLLQSLAYFDQLQSKDSSVPIGEWNRNITNQSIVDYLNQNIMITLVSSICTRWLGVILPEEELPLDRLYESFTLNVRYQNYQPVKFMR